jgi:hypothetical protein
MLRHCMGADTTLTLDATTGGWGCSGKCNPYEQTFCSWPEHAIYATTHEGFPAHLGRESVCMACLTAGVVCMA